MLCYLLNTSLWTRQDKMFVEHTSSFRTKFFYHLLLLQRREAKMISCSWTLHSNSLWSITTSSERLFPDEICADFPVAAPYFTVKSERFNFWRRFETLRRRLTNEAGRASMGGPLASVAKMYGQGQTSQWGQLSMCVSIVSQVKHHRPMTPSGPNTSVSVVCRNMNFGQFLASCTKKCYSGPPIYRPNFTVAIIAGE